MKYGIVRTLVRLLIFGILTAIVLYALSLFGYVPNIKDMLYSKYFNAGWLSGLILMGAYCLTYDVMEKKYNKDKKSDDEETTDTPDEVVNKDTPDEIEPTEEFPGGAMKF